MRTPEIEISLDDNLVAMAMTSAQIFNASLRDANLTKSLKKADLELIWSSLLFGALRYMANEKSIKLAIDLLTTSGFSDSFNSIHKQVSDNPDAKLFYNFTPEHKNWIDSVNKEIYELAFKEGLSKSANINKEYIFEQVNPMVNYYVSRRSETLNNTQKAFIQIISSSIALAAEDIISQESRYGLSATKDRYGACQVVFSLALFLFIQRD